MRLLRLFGQKQIYCAILVTLFHQTTLVEKTQCGVNHQNHAGQTALMMASLFGREDIIKLLLEHGADPQLTDYHGNTATKLAQAKRLSRVVEMIKFHIQ